MSDDVLQPVLTQDARRTLRRRWVIAMEDVGVEVDAVRPADGAGG